MATWHREFAKPWLYMLNKTHFLCCRMLTESKLRKWVPVMDSKGMTIKRILYMTKC